MWQIYQYVAWEEWQWVTVTPQQAAEFVADYPDRVRLV